MTAGRHSSEGLVFSRKKGKKNDPDALPHARFYRPVQSRGVTQTSRPQHLPPVNTRHLGGLVRGARPDLVFMITAADMSGTPGEGLIVL